MESNTPETNPSWLKTFLDNLWEALKNALRKLGLPVKAETPATITATEFAKQIRAELTQGEVVFNATSQQLLDFIEGRSSKLDIQNSMLAGKDAKGSIVAEAYYSYATPEAMVEHLLGMDVFQQLQQSEISTLVQYDENAIAGLRQTLSGKETVTEQLDLLRAFLGVMAAYDAARVNLFLGFKIYNSPESLKTDLQKDAERDRAYDPKYYNGKNAVSLPKGVNTNEKGSDYGSGLAEMIATFGSGEGRYRKTYDKRNKKKGGKLILQHESRSNNPAKGELPKSIPGSPTLPGGKTEMSTNTLMGLYQMQELGIEPGSLSSAKLENVLHPETVYQVSALMKRYNNNLALVNKYLLLTSSVLGNETSLILSGHQLNGATLEFPENYLLNSQIEFSKYYKETFPAEADVDLASLRTKYGLTETDNLYWGFNINIKLGKNESK